VTTDERSASGTRARLRLVVRLDLDETSPFGLSSTRVGERRQSAGEKVWEFAHHFQDLDKTAGGNALDEFQAHRFLEKAIRPMTIQDLRRQLAEIEVDNNKRLSLAERATAWPISTRVEKTL